MSTFIFAGSKAKAAQELLLAHRRHLPRVGERNVFVFTKPGDIPDDIVLNETDRLIFIARSPHPSTAYEWLVSRGAAQGVHVQELFRTVLQ